jgi:hypothetical protein
MCCSQPARIDHIEGRKKNLFFAKGEFRAHGCGWQVTSDRRPEGGGPGPAGDQWSPADHGPQSDNLWVGPPFGNFSFFFHFF